MNRYKNAYEIWHNGACNPRAVARALVHAIDTAVEEGSSSDAAADPAVQLVLDHLCFLCGLPQPLNNMRYEDFENLMNTVNLKKHD